MLVPLLLLEEEQEVGMVVAVHPQLLPPLPQQEVVEEVTLLDLLGEDSTVDLAVLHHRVTPEVVHQQVEGFKEVVQEDMDKT